jgi:hypothetical protein
MEVGGCVVVKQHQQHPLYPPLIGECDTLVGWADNNVGAAGAERSAQALERNSTLTLLHLLGTCNCDDL